ncbi:MAG: hypothetical protein AB1898_27850 [Acidobacteriota bacterium]
MTQPLLKEGLGFVVGVQLDPKRDLGYVAAINNRHRLMIGYCFRRRDYPWVAVWEENRAINSAPWRRRTQARGLEFGTTALPLPRSEAFAMGNLFGEPTYTHVPARGKKTIRYVGFLCRVPPDFENLKDLRAEKREILLFSTKGSQPVRLSASGLPGLFED